MPKTDVVFRFPFHGKTSRCCFNFGSFPFESCCESHSSIITLSQDPRKTVCSLILKVVIIEGPFDVLTDKNIVFFQLRDFKSRSVSNGMRRENALR